MAKGAEFERKISKQLSNWWSNGKDDAVFWRAIQSGGFATTREKSGKKSHGQYGDITAINPIGEPLIKLVNIELKNGYNSLSVMPYVDAPKLPKSSLEAFFKQSSRDATRSGAPYWWLILKRDRKVPLMHAPLEFFEAIESIDSSIRYDASLLLTYGQRKILVVPWKEFLMKVESKVVRRLWRTLND